MSATEAVRLELPGVSKIEVEYGGCGSHELAVTLIELAWGTVDSAASQLVRGVIKAARAICPHENGNINRQLDGYVLCDHCQSRLKRIEVGFGGEFRWEAIDGD